MHTKIECPVKVLLQTIPYAIIFVVHLNPAVGSQELRVALKDERLQKLLTHIDSSSNREKVSLQKAPPQTEAAVRRLDVGAVGFIVACA